MLQNKIYQNFFFEILKNFLIILFALSLIALTVRAVSFLELIVDNGYPVSTYFLFSFLNLFGIAPKFIPLSFLLSLTIFILKHLQDSEFVILWTSGLKKIQLINFLFFISLLILFFYLFFSIFLTPSALNKSRNLLSHDNLNSILPTIKNQQFSDSFKGFTFFVEKKLDNEIQNIFLHDDGNNLKNLSSNSSSIKDTTIVAENGIVEINKMILFNGNIISTKKNYDTEVIKFEQLNINLNNFSTTTIKKPKIQETSTLVLLDCFFDKKNKSNYCTGDFKKEIITNLNRRIIMPFYIPVITLLSCFLLIKTKKIFFHKVLIFLYCFIILLISELAVRLTGKNIYILIIFITTPFLFISSIYLSFQYLILKNKI